MQKKTLFHYYAYSFFSIWKKQTLLRPWGPIWKHRHGTTELEFWQWQVSICCEEMWAWVILRRTCSLRLRGVWGKHFEMFCSTRAELASSAKISRREVHARLTNPLAHKIIKSRITASGEGIVGKYYYRIFLTCMLYSGQVFLYVPMIFLYFSLAILHPLPLETLY